MNILVVNDDGYQAKGIRALVQALGEIADVYVCAPDGQRSAKSHSITLNDEVFVREIEFPGAKEAYITSGTPADCAKIGVQFFHDAGIHIDMVCSGINMGSNLGRDTLYSGTVGAAAEAALDGVQAIAVSLALPLVDTGVYYFEGVCKVAIDVIKTIYGKFDPSVVININSPNLPIDEIKGIEYPRLGDRYFIDRFEPVDGSEGYKLKGAPTKNDIYDLTAIRNGYITVTPLQFDFTDFDNLEKVKNWGLSL